MRGDQGRWACLRISSLGHKPGAASSGAHRDKKRGCLMEERRDISKTKGVAEKTKDASEIWAGTSPESATCYLQCP